MHNKLKLKMSNKYSYAIYFGVFTKEIISLGKKIILYYPKMIEYSICFSLSFFLFVEEFSGHLYYYSLSNMLSLRKFLTYVVK